MSTNKIYVTPYDEVPNGSVIKIDGKCYTKTGNKGSMTHFLSAAPVYYDDCVSCDLKICNFLRIVYFWQTYCSC